MARLGRWAVAAAAAGFVVCAPASAAPPTPGVELGGGGLYAGKGTSVTVASAAIGPDGRTARLSVQLITLCAKGVPAGRVAVTDVPIAEDGSFAVRDARAVNASAGGYRAGAGRVDVSGRFDGSTATGDVLLHDVRAKRTPKCRQARGTFTLRDPGAPAGPAVAPAEGSVVYGLTDETIDGLRGGVIAQVRPGRRLVLNLRVPVRRCTGSRALAQQLSPTFVSTAGTFDRRERYRLGYSDAVAPMRQRTQGTFVAGGALFGRFRATSPGLRFTAGPDKGRRIRCGRASDVRFAAIP